MYLKWESNQLSKCALKATEPCIYGGWQSSGEPAAGLLLGVEACPAARLECSTLYLRPHPHQLTQVSCIQLECPPPFLFARQTLLSLHSPRPSSSKILTQLYIPLRSPFSYSAEIIWFEVNLPHSSVSNLRAGP